MKAAESFEKTSVEETFDENLFIEFMKKVAIWDYFAISGGGGFILLTIYQFYQKIYEQSQFF